MCNKTDIAPEGYTWIICKCITQKNGKRRCKENGFYKFKVKIK